MTMSSLPWSVILVLVILSCSTKIHATSLQCTDESGLPVDWYIVYKYPYIKTKPATLFSGYNYAFLTSNSSSSNGWHLSTKRINTPQSIFAQTLTPILPLGSKGDQLSAVLYSDQPPDTEVAVSAPAAHAKGVLASYGKTGFWLIHTVPRFVSGEKTYEYPNSGGRYGQVALCISLAETEINKVVQNNFLLSQINAYQIKISSNTKSPLVESLESLKKKKWTTDAKFHDTSLTSLAGTTFRSFYKNPTDHIDLYAGIVAQQLNSPLYVETWRKNPGAPLNSSCALTSRRVENVQELSLSFANSEETGSFDYLNDHSKWAMSETASVGGVCLGDINRVESQFKRGGGTTCLFSPSVWKSFNKIVSKYEKCGTLVERGLEWLKNYFPL